MAINQVQKVTEIITSPKVGMAGSSVGILSYLTDAWQWLGGNISIIVGIVSVIVGVVSIWNQIDQIRHRGRNGSNS